MRMHKVESTNILFCGTGGQGVLSAAEVCGWAAVLEGYHVKKSEVHGMAQRGGSVESHLRFGKQIFSPLIPKGKADFLVSFHKEEHARLKDFLKPKGVELVSHSDKRLQNTFLLGVLSSYLPLREQSWFKAIEIVFAGKRVEENKAVFLQGRGGSAESAHLPIR